MKTNPTPLAVDIFTHVQRRDQYAVFLIHHDEGPLLSAGFGRTTLVVCEALLQTTSMTVDLSTPNCLPFALLMDRGGPEHSPRLLLYQGEGPDPILEYTQESEGNADLKGSVLIMAQSETGNKEAIVHAVFAGKDRASLTVLPSYDLLPHLHCCADIITGGIQ